MQNKLTLLNSNEVWNPKKRYKINSTVSFLGSNFQNTTGFNTQPDLLLDWIVTTVNLSQNLRFQTVWNTGNSQTFTIPNTFYQIQDVIVQGISLKDTQYTIVGNTQVTINDTLVNGEYVIILYGTNASSNNAPYYTQAQVDAKDALKVDIKYKVYTALLTQTGTAAPTAIVLENTLGGTVVFSYNNIGLYVGTLTGIFTTNKTAFYATPKNSNPGKNLSLQSNTTNNFVIACRVGTVETDGVLNGDTIEVRVYN